MKTQSPSLKATIRALFDNVEYDELDLHSYQETMINFMLENPFSALFVDLGLGKTVACLTLISRLLDRFAYGHCLVIAPKRVATQTWPNEIPLWRHTAHMSHSLIRAEDEASLEMIAQAGRERRATSWYRDMPESRDENNKKRRNVFLEQDVVKAKAEMKEKLLRRMATAEASMHIVSRDQLEWLVELFGKKWPFDFVIVDESSGFKDHNSNRFKALKKVRKYITRMHLLTATPAAETYMHLFAQIFLLDEGERFGRMITVFRDRYFIYNQWSRSWKLRPGAEDEISKKIADICLVMKADDYLPLEKPVLLRRPLRLEPHEKDQYDSFEKEFILDLEDGTEIEAETAAALSQKLLQLASGAVYDKDRKTHFVHDHKIADLEQLVEELDGDCLMVAYWFESSLARLKKAFPYAKVMDKEGKLLKDWNKGKIKMLLVHPQGVAHGLNLQKGGRDLYLFDIFYSLELYLQLIGRLARQGQRFAVRVHHAAMQGTIDVLAVDALVEKRDAQEGLFIRLKKFRKKLLEERARKNREFADCSGL